MLRPMTSLRAVGASWGRVAFAMYTIGGAALGLALASCASDAFSGGGDGGFDSGGFPADASAPSPLPVFHAALGAFDVRLCWAVAGDDPARTMLGEPAPADRERPMPRTNYPGVPTGGAAFVSVPFPEGARELVPYMLKARRLEFAERRGRTCAELFCRSASPVCVERNADYRALPPVPVDPLRDGTHALVLTGCLPRDEDPEANEARCGDNYDPVQGNLQARLVPLPQPPSPPDGAVSATFLHLSTPLRGAAMELTYRLPAEGAGSAGDGAVADAGDAGGNDGGDRDADAGDGGGSGATVPSASVAAAAFTATPAGVFSLPSREDLTAFARAAFVVTPRGDGGASFPFTLADVQRASAPLVLPPAYFDGAALLLALVGDPAEASEAPEADGGADASADGGNGDPPRPRGLNLIALRRDR